MINSFGMQYMHLSYRAPLLQSVVPKSDVQFCQDRRGQHLRPTSEHISKHFTKCQMYIWFLSFVNLGCAFVSLFSTNYLWQKCIPQPSFFYILTALDQKHPTSAAVLGKLWPNCPAAPARSWVNIKSFLIDSDDTVFIMLWQKETGKCHLTKTMQASSCSFLFVFSSDLFWFSRNIKSLQIRSRSYTWFFIFYFFVYKQWKREHVYFQLLVVVQTHSLNFLNNHPSSSEMSNSQ